MFDLFRKLKGALTRAKNRLAAQIQALFARPWDEASLSALEKILYEADLGSSLVADFVAEVRRQGVKESGELLNLLKEKALAILSAPPRVSGRVGNPQVYLVVGVNGGGKTTSIAKLAHAFQREGKSVLLAAADTFRAAAVEQLATWAERLGVEIVKGKPGGDPAAVVFDALAAAKARGKDVVLIDTAGRLQNKGDLMQELGKVYRLCSKGVEGAPHEVILVIDATLGQNAVEQARVFSEVTPVSAIFLTKLDGSAKGGVALAIYRELGIPIRWVGVGEGAEDVEAFEARAYVEGLFG